MADLSNLKPGHTTSGSGRKMFPNRLCMKGSTETKRRRTTGRQPGTKSASRLSGTPLVNGEFCSFSSIGLQRVCFVRASEE